MAHNGKPARKSRSYLTKPEMNTLADAYELTDQLGLVGTHEIARLARSVATLLRRLSVAISDQPTQS